MPVVVKYTTLNTTDNANTIPLTETLKSHALSIVKVLSLNGNQIFVVGLLLDES